MAITGNSAYLRALRQANPLGLGRMRSLLGHLLA
jgi:hypothetical protein